MGKPRHPTPDPLSQKLGFHKPRRGYCVFKSGISPIKGTSFSHFSNEGSGGGLGESPPSLRFPLTEASASRGGTPQPLPQARPVKETLCLQSLLLELTRNPTFLGKVPTHPPPQHTSATFTSPTPGLWPELSPCRIHTLKS